ncbi:MAG: VOC family protein [Acidobacteria bacterium]|nr:VOC family protein [Acidobacteriota bacterium]MBV9479092.1 VOC family protein [Acidobacteriota bacterium]
MGKPVVHWELWSKDPEKVGRFYADVFDWEVTFIEALNYRLVDTRAENGINGGITTPQDGPWPGNLALYIDVDDLDAYRAKIEAAGGTTLVPRMEIPNMGALALFEDPDRRVFGIWQRGGAQ